MIEFSLFVLRQPQRKKHLVALHNRLLKGIEAVFEDLSGNARQKQPALPRSVIGLGFTSLVQGFVLQEMLNEDLISPKISNELLGIYLHAVFGEL
jgi:hypothetical protein